MNTSALRRNPCLDFRGTGSDLPWSLYMCVRTYHYYVPLIHRMSRRRPCACRCGSEVTGETERRHLIGKGPSSLIHAILAENNMLPTERRQRPSLRNRGKQQIVGRRRTQRPAPPQSDALNFDPPSPSRNQHVPLETATNEIQELQMGEVGPFMGNGSNEPPHDDDGLPMPRRSTRVMERISQISKSRWRPGISRAAVDDDEESDEEMDMVDEADANNNEDDIEEEAENNSELGQEDNALWDILDEDFLAEAARLGGLMPLFLRTQD